MHSGLELRVEVAGPEHGALLGALFERAGTRCYCQYWHFAGDKNAWLERLAREPEANRTGLARLLTRPELSGLVALHAGQAAGWMKLCQAAELGKLYALGPYRARKGPPDAASGVYAIGCMLVEPRLRRRGVARALLAAGIEAVRSRGGRALEAFPRRAEAAGDPELWMGPFDVFVEAGFQMVSREFPAYPILRLDL